MRVELRGVRKRFGKNWALKGIDLTIERGSRVALIGPNGSGKSTLLRAILGMVGCEGEVALDGMSPFARRVEVADRLAYVPQVAPALAAPVSDLLQLVAGTRGIPAGRIEEAASRLLLDLRAIRCRPFRHLSGGMKQKLLLALAFAARPSLLVLDEPTASLDALARGRFFERIKALPDETTVLVCSHRIEEVGQLSTRVVALEEGLVSWDGTSSRWLETASPLRLVRDEEEELAHA